MAYPSGKRGRNSLREIKRVRPQKTEEKPITEPEIDESEPEEQEEPLENPRQAYNALMTLLDDGEPRKKHKKLKKTPQIAPQTEIETETVQNAEELQKEQAEEEQDVSDDEEENEKEQSDPFVAHFNSPDETLIELMASEDSSGNKSKWSLEKQVLGDGCIVVEQKPPLGREFTKKSEDLCIKPRVKASLKPAHEAEEKLLNAIFNYQDVVYPYKDYNNESRLREIAAVHSVNHVFKTRDRILKNNVRLSNFKEAVEAGRAQETDEPELRDQGFHRPKVLVLLPTNESCYEFVNKIIEAADLGTVENRKRFNKLYHSDAVTPEYKPLDFRYLFNGNSNDNFCIGVKMTRKTVKLYAAFAQSDIILASPAALREMFGRKDKAQKAKEMLSLIEVTIVDQATSLQYQNWASVSMVLKHLNEIPETYSDDLDFSRLRMWAINGHYRYLRQCIVMCRHATPEINSVLGSLRNLAGKVKFAWRYPGVVRDVMVKVKQVFSRFECETPQSEPEARFGYFKSNIVPFLKESLEDREEGGTLLYIPDYSDYLRVKKYLKFDASVNFCSVDEYMEQGPVTRARLGFQAGKTKVMLYTERMHHYHRYEIKGVKNVVFYKAPSDETYYKEVVMRFLGDSLMRNVIKDLALSSVRVAYSKWDGLFLERLVGSEKVGVLCFGAAERYEFK